MIVPIVIMFAALGCSGAWAQAIPSNGLVVGSIQDITIADPNDRYSAGTITIGGRSGRGVGGDVVVIPRNLLIDLPANRLTLQELFVNAPAACALIGVTGLAGRDKNCEGGTIGTASILANRLLNGQVVAGEVFIEKGQETLSGRVTYINYVHGYLRVNGDGTNDDTTGGTAVRINDPGMRYTIQRGRGCSPGVGSADNCSADVRFGVDPDNYTVTFSNGYPGCIPSRLQASNATTHNPPVTRIGRSSTTGLDDPFCPHINRQGLGNGNPVDDATRFAPIQLNDHIVAAGNYERIRGADFLSAHTLTVSDALTTADDPSQPDYMVWDEVEWDTAGFQNARIKALMIAFTTRNNAFIDVFSLHVNSDTGANLERPLASSLGCELTGGVGSCQNQGVPPTDAGVVKIGYDIDFFVGVDPDESPCAHLLAGGLLSFCVDDASVMLPITREVIGRTDHILNPGVETLDINGQSAPNGEYLTPVGIGHPEFGEIDLERLHTPFIFAGQGWNLDRRLGPNGCAEGVDCSADIDTALDPFPFSCLDPATQAPGTVPNGVAAFRTAILSALGGGAVASVEPVYNTLNCQ